MNDDADRKGRRADAQRARVRRVLVAHVHAADAHLQIVNHLFHKALAERRVGLVVAVPPAKAAQLVPQQALELVGEQRGHLLGRGRHRRGAAVAAAAAAAVEQVVVGTQARARDEKDAVDLGHAWLLVVATPRERQADGET